MTDYLTTLAGAPPQGEAARAFYERVAKLTGMPLDVVTKTHGFVADDYVKNLRAADGKIVSRYDATFAVDDPFPELRSARGAIRSSTAFRAPMAAPWPLTRATSSASRPR